MSVNEQTVSAEAVSILIADDHSVVRRGVKDILVEEFPGASFGEAETRAQLLTQLEARPWTIVLLDLGFPDGSGLEVLEECRQRFPGVKVLVLSMFPEEKFAIRVLKLGALGYVNKQSAPAEVVKAIRQLLAGQRYMSQIMSETLAASDGELDDGDTQELSARELQVITGIARGKAMKEIAGELELSLKSASTYRVRAMRKLNLKNNAEIVLYALDHGIIQPRSAAVVP